MTDVYEFENKTAAYFTLGCKLNFAETSTVGKELAALGIRRTRLGEQADFCIINTCSVTELADKKCRQMIRRIHKSHPEAFTIVTGCYAQLKPDDIAQIEGVDLVLGAEQKNDISKYVKDIVSRNKKPASNIIASPVKDVRTFVPSCSADDRTRHFLKVQDGCDYFCTYCTIPHARGRSRNGAIADIVKQAEQVADSRGKEIVLTGVNIGDFGKSTGEQFIDLIKALDKIKGIERFRISSIEPDLITDEIISFVAESNRFMPHFHIPLQSGSDTVLKLMHRHYDTALFRQKTEQIKKLMPDAFIGVDVIVGTRGETDEFFNEAKSFIESIPFTQLHVFSYSERPNTQALKIKPVVSPDKKHERSKLLLDLSEKRTHDFYETHIGKTARVLFEHAKKGQHMQGFTENYIKTEIAYQKALCNEIREVKITGWNEDNTALTTEIID
ncbi:MAG: tRNA (N(6)-L-threonylcarbamoyladenosine(37)-C(2))-methylthiotransferase MtaB [Tannerella sp.]|nr:tRNA (N(6)-L-threonylcarbamoyladenosine(37)-C(2))-methylthiotransferase MtaB [Tannerella sp.]